MHVSARTKFNCCSQISRKIGLAAYFGLIVISSQAQDSQSTDTGTVAPRASLEQQVFDLKAIVTKLQARVDELEKLTNDKPESAKSTPAAANTAEQVTQTKPTSSSTEQTERQPTPPAPTQPEKPPQPKPTGSPQEQASAAGAAEQAAIKTLPPGTTVNLFLDTYYEYNFNQPIGRVNLLRAYDALSNGFSINQTGVMFEHAPDPEHDSRLGFRLDLQYGQATQTLQGNAGNEPRPEIYRNIFQGYGTYVAPIGKGLTIDVGKFASSLGYEGNYTKDQINYTRSFWFNFLPFYHLGLRANYKFNNLVAFNYWIVNGTNQSEPFNGFKDQFFGFVVTPNKNVTWNIQYYLGQEHADTMYFPNGSAPLNAPTLQGVPFEPIPNSPTGKLHIIDTYVSWLATPKLTVALEADDFIQRLYTYSPPAHSDGGAAYVKYQFTQKFYGATRFEYLADHGGSFTGTTQDVKENTLTAAYRLYEGFQFMAEWRRDVSSEPYFYTSKLGTLKRSQTTATLGFLWWFGGKEGAW
jgi:hypothetical protein